MLLTVRRSIVLGEHVLMWPERLEKYLKAALILSSISAGGGGDFEPKWRVRVCAGSSRPLPVTHGIIHRKTSCRQTEWKLYKETSCTSCMRWLFGAWLCVIFTVVSSMCVGCVSVDCRLTAVDWLRKICYTTAPSALENARQQHVTAGRVLKNLNCIKAAVSELRSILHASTPYSKGVAYEVWRLLFATSR